ncbi:MAG: hypothetical protein UHM23_07905 [Clostridia bacterium]|nr:hypothetical protein [Clostridia bacterium]
MKDLTKKVVILENLASPYVHQAILVMRDYNPKLESKAVIEAERIVSAYLDNMKLKSGQGYKKPVRKKYSFLSYLAISAISVLISVAVMKL